MRKSTQLSGNYELKTEYRGTHISFIQSDGEWQKTLENKYLLFAYREREVLQAG